MNKSHDPDSNRQSVDQVRVLNAVAQSGALNDVASKSGVDVTTICSWLETNPDFEAAFRLKVREREENARLARVRLIEQALDVLSFGLTDPQLAFRVLKEFGRV